jgi:prolipoprotein diacylglyceryltransferase/protein-S-isoprenylcysteine O-methyltransferase Ste14
MENTLILDVHPKSHWSVLAIILLYIFIFWLFLPVFLLAVGLRLDMLAPVAMSAKAASTIFGWSLVVCGFSLMAASMGQLWLLGRGLPISHLPPVQFVACGVYRVFRHPIYLGFNSAFAGLSLLIGSFWSLAFSYPLLLAGWIIYARFYEEPALIKRFGDSYRAYMETTPMVFPKKMGRLLAVIFRPLFKTICTGLTILARRPVLFRKGSLILVTNGLFVMTGAFLFVQHVTTLFLIQGLQKSHVAVYLVGTMFSASFFGYFFWWLGHWRELIRQPWLGIKNNGFVSFGAFFGLIFASALFAWVYRYPALMITDVVVRGMYINYAIGRLGCVTYGCCWGKASTHYGILYQNPQAKVLRLTGKKEALCYPTQAFSSLEGLFLFFLLNGLAFKRLPAGFLTAMVFLVYPVGRAFIEFFRERKLHFQESFNEGHLSCAVMFLLGLALLFSLSPAISGHSPRPWNGQAFVEGLSLVPLTLLIGFCVFFVTSFHWKRIGTW